MSDQANGRIRIPEHEIAPPGSLSPSAQAYLAAAANRISATQASGESKSSAALVDAGAEAALQFMRPLASRFRCDEQAIVLSTGSKLYRIAGEGRQGRHAEVAYFDIHGGGFVAGGGELCRTLAKLRAMEFGVEVFAVDYRLLPDHPYPAALDDCMAAYREVLKAYDSKNVILCGSSAGGNLAAALMLRSIKEGLALPAALVLGTPALDLTLCGDSYQTNRYLDVNLYGATDVLKAYAPGHDQTDPLISPLFGEFGGDWPPTMLTTGTRDILLSDTVRMHRALRRAGVEATLHVAEAAPHGGFMASGAPEDSDIMAEWRRFVYAALGLPMTARA